MPDRRVVPAPSIERPDIDRLADTVRRHLLGSNCGYLPQHEPVVALDELVALARGDENFVRAEAAEAERASMEYRAEDAEARVAELKAALRGVLSDDDLPNHWDDCVCSWCSRVRTARSLLAGDGGGA